MNIIKITYIISIIGIGVATITGILQILFSGWIEAVSTVSTILSIILSLVSIVYTYKSNIDTTNTLHNIEESNKKLVAKITLELCKDNYNEYNIKSLSEKNKKDRDKLLSRTRNQNSSNKKK